MRLLRRSLLFLAMGMLLCVLPAEASSRLAGLIKTLKTHSNYKIRLTAVIGISKYVTPQAVKALREAVRNRKEHPYVRGFAALGLGKMKALHALKDIKRVARSRNRFLRKKARKAMRMMCGRRLPRRRRGKKRLYINISKVSSSGVLSTYARGLMLLNIQRILARRSNVILAWPRCRRVRRWMLRRYRVKGYFIRMKLKLNYSGGKISSSLSLLFTTYPRDNIKGSVSASANAATSPGTGIVTRLVNVMTSSLKRDIYYFLDSR